MTDAEIIDGILQREGSTYTDRSSDRGGATKFGITIDTLASYRGHGVTPSEVAELTRGEARAIYQREFIERPGFTHVANDRLRALLIDYSVNSGPSRAVKALQRALGVPEDGRLGPETLGKIAGAHSQLWLDQVYDSVLGDRIRHYVDIVLTDPHVRRFRSEHPDTQLGNLRGWISRALEFL